LDLSRARKLPAFISDFEDFNSSVNVDSDGKPAGQAMPLPNTGANWIPVGNGVNDDSVPATVPRHFTPNRVELAPAPYPGSTDQVIELGG